LLSRGFQVTVDETIANAEWRMVHRKFGCRGAATASPSLSSSSAFLCVPWPLALWKESKVPYRYELLFMTGNLKPPGQQNKKTKSEK
jgi:hypothetical protein